MRTFTGSSMVNGNAALQRFDRRRDSLDDHRHVGQGAPAPHRRYVLVDELVYGLLDGGSDIGHGRHGSGRHAHIRGNATPGTTSVELSSAMGARQVGTAFAAA